MSWREDADLALLAAGTARAGRVRTGCPFCLSRDGKRTRDSFVVDFVRGRYGCFRCGADGRLPDGARPAEELEPERELEAPRAPKSFTLLTAPAISIEPARQYLYARGVSWTFIVEAGLGACPVGDFAGRVVTPVYDLDGNWVWHSGRAWSKVHAKPHMFPSGKREGLLYNERALYVDDPSPVLVVESTYDTGWFWPFGAVGTLGKPQPAHLDKIASSKRPKVFCSDGDAHEEAWGFMQLLRLRGCGDVGSIRMPPKKDPDEYPRAFIEELAWRALEQGEVDAAAYGA